MGKIANAKRLKNELAASTGVKLNGFQKLGLLMDYLYEHHVYGVRPVEYIQFDFYWKRRCDRRRYACKREYDRIVQVSNKKEDYRFFDDKVLFNTTFSQYLGRDWLDMTKCSLEDFTAMIKRHKKLFIKPIHGWFGNGAYVLDTAEDSPEKLFERLRAEKVIVEEIVQQHEELAQFNATSVNTLRVVTMLCPDQSVKIPAAILRMGRNGKVVDNFHFHGIAAAIDVETGCIMTRGVDKTYVRYVAHPDSGKIIVGYRIPHWEAVLRTVKEAAKMVPTVRYIGWDVAIGKDGQVMIIEGNKSAEPDAEQITERSGHWPMYKEILKLYEKE